MDRWEGKVAVVTGASAGIGTAIVEALAKAGLRVVALARRLDRLEQLAKKLDGAKGKVYPKQCDVTKEEDILNSLKWVESELGGVDILVNNAGVSTLNKLIDDSIDAFRNILDTNVLAIAIAIKTVVASMKRRNVPGHIINMNSVTGHAIPTFIYSISLYTASKYAVTALTETVRKELATDADNKIKITSISPGVVETEMLKNSGAPNPDEVISVLPHLDSIDIANAVLYVLGTPQNVLVSELTIRPILETL